MSAVTRYRDMAVNSLSNEQAFKVHNRNQIKSTNWCW